MKNYILVSRTKTNTPNKNSWKLIFQGRRLEALSAYNDEEMFQYDTGKQALLVALRMQTFTPAHTMIVVDPSLKSEKEASDTEKVTVSDKELILT